MTSESLAPDQRARSLGRAGTLAVRWAQLLIGLVLFGASMGVVIQAGLGVMPWDVLHQGLDRWLSLSFGTITILTGAIVLLLWIPLGQRPGVGTVANILVIGLVIDRALAILPHAQGLPMQVSYLLAGVLINALATAMYIGAGMGPGPRDGLMTSLVARTGGSIRLVRSLIEIAVVSTGWLLGGVVGVGTLIFAIGIGPVIQIFMPWFDWRPSVATNSAPDASMA